MTYRTLGFLIAGTFSTGLGLAIVAVRGLNAVPLAVLAAGFCLSLGAVLSARKSAPPRAGERDEGTVLP